MPRVAGRIEDRLFARCRHLAMRHACRNVQNVPFGNTQNLPVDICNQRALQHEMELLGRVAV
jgi:hypothetical protein